MRKALAGLMLFVGLLLVPSAAQAAFPADAFNGAVACNPAPNQAPVAGQIWCTGSPSKVPSFDNTPIDVAFYAPGNAGPYPVIGVYHGYGGVKYAPTSTDVQRWMSRGYAVFTMTDRGFRQSCGTNGGGAGSPECVNGYVHLLSNQFEVRDAQHLLGLLADDNAIQPKKIGAVGQSYGGGMSAQLGALRNRIQLGAVAGEVNGQLAPWTSPAGKEMEIAATAPEFGWTDLSYSLVPNGSTLDYAAFNPYRGPAEQPRRAGIEKAAWTESLYFGGLSGPTNPNGFYCGLGNPCNDDRFNLPAIRNALTGTNDPLTPDTSTPAPPYDNNPTIQNALDELRNFHSAYGTDDSVPPAPALFSNGWNDDLFPVDEAVRYYNKVREKYPNTPINIWAFDWGHPMRTAINTDNALALFGAEARWMDFYIRGIGQEPEDPNGGVNTISSGCTTEASNGLPTSSPIVHSKNWASLSKGELAATVPAAQAIDDAAAPTGAFQTFPASNNPPTICTTAPDTDVNAAYARIPAQAAAYTVAGSPTISLELTTHNANDALLGRLYDVNPGAGNRRLIARGALRPYGTQPGINQQVFQLHPQQWKVAAGHTLELELLAQDSPYARRTQNQSDMTIRNLELRVPTLEATGGAIRPEAAKVLPTGYVLARDERRATPAPAPTASPTPAPTPAPTAKRKPRLTAGANPELDPRKPFVFRVQGRLVRPAGITKSAGCKGTVRVVAKKGGEVVGRRRTGIKSTCKYKARVKLRKAGKRGKVKFQATYLGSDVLLKAKARTTAEYGTSR